MASFLIFFPPAAFKDRIVEKANHYVEEAGHLLTPVFAEAIEKKTITAEKCRDGGSRLFMLI
ncbi:hypothetical protein GCM10020331_040440 [Ectobacillus funiculus]